MTVHPITQAGQCNVCGRPTGNLPRHRPACARAHGRPAVAGNLTDEEEALVYRAGTHAVHEHLLESALRWQKQVTDLSIARLLFQIESGTVIVPSSSGKTWVPLTTMPLMRPSLTTTVNEALRLKVVQVSVERSAESAYRTFLTAAPTHARWIHNKSKPACRKFSSGATRWRLLDREHLMYVDCQTCMDVPASSVATLR